MSALPRYLLPRNAEVDPGGRLRVGGVDLLDLADEIGTPLFAYDEEHIRHQCRDAVSAWGEGVAYGSKAFLCRAMARIAHEEGMSIDVATGGELHVVLDAGVPPDAVVMHGNNKSDRELRYALESGVGRMVVDSFDEIDRLGRLTSGGRLSDRPPRLLVRVTPGVEAHTHEYIMTGQTDSKFGFGLASGHAAQAVERIRALEEAGQVELVGVHSHIGSQIFITASFERAVEALSEFFRPLGLPELCVGGGLGVPYVTGESAPTMAEWAETVRSACSAYGIDPATRVTAEPGRSIVATAGMTLYTVGTIKELPGLRTYVAVDGGMSDNPRPVLYGSGYEAFLPRATHGEREMTVTIVGKHCESGDFIVRDTRVPSDIRVGDVIITPVTGAYGHSMASNYNKVPRPPVVFLAGGSARTVVRRETFEDLVALDT